MWTFSLSDSSENKLEEKNDNCETVPQECGISGIFLCKESIDIKNQDQRSWGVCCEKKVGLANNEAIKKIESQRDVRKVM